MPTLLERPSEEALRLLQRVATGYLDAGGQWPVWQWVRAGLDADGLDGEEVLRRLPAWQYNYQSVWAARSAGQLPDLGDRVALTVHGLVHVSRMATDHMLNAFLAALAEVQEAQADSVSMPTEVVKIEVEGIDFTQRVNVRAGSNLAPGQLSFLLSREPATWSGVQERNGSFTWDLTRTRLRRYRGVKSGQEYLQVLEGLVGIPVVSAQVLPLSPLALPEAFDHLDLAWRLLTNQRLVRVPRALLAAKLTLPVASGDEFESRLSGLADLLAGLMLPAGELPPETKSLMRLRAEIQRLLNDQADTALRAVSTLQSIAGLRNSQQHQGSIARYDSDRAALGLERFGTDWPEVWEHLKAVTVNALTTLREEISTLLDDG
jgi:hypothetical protein